MKRICSSPSNILWEQIVNPAPPPVKNLHKKAEQPDGPGHSATTLLIHNEDKAKVVIFEIRTKRKRRQVSRLTANDMGKMEKYLESVGQTHRGSESCMD